jgi:hypothetical protein
VLTRVATRVHINLSQYVARRSCDFWSAPSACLRAQNVTSVNVEFARTPPRNNLIHAPVLVATEHHTR